MAKDITERLFREEEIAGSPCDLKISNLTPDAVSSDKRLAALHKAMTKNSKYPRRLAYSEPIMIYKTCLGMP